MPTDYIKYLMAIITAFSLLVAIWAIRSHQDIALKSGAFDKPNPCLYLGGHKLLPDSETRIIYGFSFDDPSNVVTNLPLGLINEGEKTLNKVSITIRYPQTANIILPEELITLKTSGRFFPENEPKRKTSKIDPFEFSSWYIKEINPNIMVDIEEPFSLIESKPLVKTFRDHKGQWFRLSADYSLPLVVSISAENVKVQDYALLLYSLKSSDMDDLMQKYNIKVKERSRHIRDSISYFNYLVLFFKQIMKNDLLIYLSKDNKGNLRIYSYYPLSL